MATFEFSLWQPLMFSLTH